MTSTTDCVLAAAIALFALEASAAPALDAYPVRPIRMIVPVAPGFATVSTAAVHMKSGKIRTIANTSAQRSDLFPDLPTVAESGVPGFAIDNWYSFVAPAGVPRPIVDKLHGEINRILVLPDVKERLHGLGIVAFPSASPEEFRNYLAAEIDKYGKLVKAAGIQAD
jgi:tripartite-type tricarboxylate transporter receptor subunit TctC